MKNVQIIDGAQNCVYAIWQFTNEQFAVIFPEPGQNIEFIEDAEERVGADVLDRAFQGVWDRPVRKDKVVGIHGTLLYRLDFKKKYYPNKSERDVSGPPNSPSTMRGLYDD